MPKAAPLITEEMVDAATRVLWRSGYIPLERQSQNDKGMVLHMLRAALVNRVKDGPAVIDGRQVWVSNGIACWHDGWTRLEKPATAPE